MVNYDLKRKLADLNDVLRYDLIGCRMSQKRSVYCNDPE